MSVCFVCIIGVSESCDNEDIEGSSSNEISGLEISEMKIVFFSFINKHIILIFQDLC